MTWATLKYGVASGDYDTYSGAGKRRPDSQLGGIQGEILRARYPQLMIRQITKRILPAKEMAHLYERYLVSQYQLAHNGENPPEQGLPFLPFQ
ncbi:hypothetical protein LZZ85_13065 [Terrimonas sp. NA20]|uniref:Uncharacterized protein n=1 Tax=Terrimonas ginsenosidimutans TaxID=2908004 RepID=A0ABS9KSD3_9BACT|nr:hypothetical protein [Terrimonas ginsenosidimutans]MCG2615224.1 hypothetical protein [Terrimonas ginsenosidimutans]